MSDFEKSLGSLVSDMGDAVRKEILGGLRPALAKLSAAVAELEAKLDAAEKGGGTAKKRRGRPVGSGKAKAARKGAKRGAKRSPRGALQSAVKDVLGKSKKPMKLSQIRDGVLKNATFKDRDPKTLYTMIVFAVKKLPEVSRTPAGLYSLNAKSGGTKSKKK